MQQRSIGAGPRRDDLAERLRPVFSYPTATEAEWEDHLAEVVRIRTETGAPPRKSKDPALYRWIHRQRRLHDQGKLSERQVTDLERIPGLLRAGDPAPSVKTAVESRAQRSAESWDRRWQELSEFIETNESLPWNSYARQPAERCLAVWLSNQRSANKEGRLLPHQAHLLCGVPRFLEGRVDPVGMIESFTQRHGRLPEEASIDPGEADLGRHLRELRTRHREGAWDDLARVPAFLIETDEKDARLAA